jgi:GcrA cell cycle regulator
LETIMSWTNERVERLKTLWTEGQSASAIAATLGEVTRNAVIGKVHRLGLAGRAGTSRRGRTARHSPLRHSARPRPRRAHGAVPKPVSSPRAKPLLLELGPAPEIPVTVARLTAETCRWPEGDPKLAGFHFCGRPKAEAPGPYCGVHAAIAYR